MEEYLGKYLGKKIKVRMGKEECKGELLEVDMDSYGYVRGISLRMRERDVYIRWEAISIIILEE